MKLDSDVLPQIRVLRILDPSSKKDKAELYASASRHLTTVDRASVSPRKSAILW